MENKQAGTLFVFLLQLQYITLKIQCLNVLGIIGKHEYLKGSINHL